MSTPIVRKRNEIPVEFTWNAPSVFASKEDWEKEYERLQAEAAPAIQRFHGHLAEGSSMLKEAIQTFEDLNVATGKVLVYATLTAATNTADPQGGQMEGRAWSLIGDFTAAASFLEPEMLGIGQKTIQAWIDQDPDLKVYQHYFDDLFRKQEHVRSEEVEELLGMLMAPFSSTGTTASVLVDADFTFRPAVTSTGQEAPVTQGTLHEILTSTDRQARRSAWESYYDTFLAFKTTLASNLSTSMQQNVFLSRARRYDSSLEAKLSEFAIPVEVFYNLIDTFQRNVPTWQRYWAVRRKMLGVDRLHPSDIWAPLTDHPAQVPFRQAVDWVAAALAPLGEEYVNILKQGVLEQRWIDVYPSLGKASAQFSAGWPGTHPFIFLNYDETIFSASTTAHELGHSLHSYLTWHNQPVLYGQYSLFVAEVASNFHQAMMRAYLLANNPDPNFQISVIEEAMSNFHRYFFIMPTLARFELEMHQRIERGQGVSAEIMNQRMAELFAEGYGPEVDMDPARTGITWATFGHLYQDYYVYQYATGISAANALSKHILDGEPGAAERYLSFLRAGNSVYPLDALKMAGVDLTTPEPVEEAFQVLAGLVERLEKLAG